jgi:hypothetical protein
MGQIRQRIKHTTTLEERLAAFADKARGVAAYLPPGAEKDEMLRKAQNADAAADLNKLFPPQPTKYVCNA